MRGWSISGVGLLGLDPAAYGTHSLLRTKVALLYKKTGNLRACQLLLGHTKLESTVRYLGVEVDDALELSEALELCLTSAMGGKLTLAAAAASLRRSGAHPVCSTFRSRL